MMPAYLVMTGMGLDVHYAEVSPVQASDREIAGEPRGIVHIVCAWTQTPLGLSWGLPEQHGQISHGISPAAAAVMKAEVAAFAGKHSPVSK